MSIAEKLTTIAENMQGIYDKGYEAGATKHNKDFWWAFTMNGSREDYRAAFYKQWWFRHTFTPTNNIKPKNAYYMFCATDPNAVSNQVDMEELEQTQKMKFDFSQCTDFRYAFAGGFFKVLNVIDVSSLTNSSNGAYLFYGGYDNLKLQRINKLIFSENTAPVSTWFGSNAITHIGFDGVLAKNGLSVSSLDLDHESLLSLIDILKNYSASTSGTTYTITIGSTNMAKLSEDEKQIIYDKGWAVK